jgi:hypothetical protein
MIDNSKKAQAFAQLRQRGALSDPGEEYIARTLSAQQLEVCAKLGIKPSAFTKETAAEARARTVPAGQEQVVREKIRHLLGLNPDGTVKRHARAQGKEQLEEDQDLTQLGPQANVPGRGHCGHYHAAFDERVYPKAPGEDTEGDGNRKMTRDMKCIICGRPPMKGEFPGLEARGAASPMRGSPYGWRVA